METTVVIHEMPVLNIVLPEQDADEPEGIFDLTFDTSFE